MMPVDEAGPKGNHSQVMGWSHPEEQFSYRLIPTIIKRALLAEVRPLWRDVSYYQGNIDTEVMRVNGVLGVIARAGVSWGILDSKFKTYWDQIGDSGLLRSSYHVIYTDQSIIEQADRVWYKQHPTLDYVPRVIDFEVNRPDAVGHKAEALWAMSELVHGRDGIRPIIYSRYLLVNQWLGSWTVEMLNAHTWWLAQYLLDRTKEHPGPPTLPDRVLRENVILHQTSDKRTPFPGEVQSLGVDWDRWCLGDEAQMRAWIVEHWGYQAGSWYGDIDAWARGMGFTSPYPPPG